jgi:hypothetical protein
MDIFILMPDYGGYEIKKRQHQNVGQRHQV